MRNTEPSPPTALHVAQSVETGVAFALEEHIRHQQASGWRIAVACPGGSLETVALGAGATVVRWQAARHPGLSVLREILALRRIIAEVQPDIIHLHSAKAGLVGRLVVRGKRPTVFTPHAWSWLAVDGVVRRMARRWERWGSRWAHAIICLSPGEVTEAREVGIRQRVDLIPNDVPTQLLRSLAPTSREVARAAVGEGDGLLVVCAARLAPQKGQDILLDAWQKVAARWPDARLALVGDGPDRDVLQRSVEGDPNVRFVGMQGRSETLAWMKAADVVVCPSRYEGMSLVPLEAAALGVPVVATSVEGMDSSLPEMSRRLVAVEDVDALAQALLETLADDEARERGGRQAWVWSDEVASTVGACTRTLQLYGNLLGSVVGSRGTTSRRENNRD